MLDTVPFLGIMLKKYTQGISKKPCTQGWFMKNIIFSIFFAFFILGCSKSGQENVSVVKVGNVLKPFTFDDQFEKPHTLTKDTKKIIFVFAKKSGHAVRKYFNTKPVDYLKKHHYVFIADVSGMPSIIYKMFAKSDLQEHKYPIWLIFDGKKSTKFIYPDKSDKIMVADLKEFKIIKVNFAEDVKQLKKILNAQ